MREGVYSKATLKLQCNGVKKKAMMEGGRGKEEGGRRKLEWGRWRAEGGRGKLEGGGRK
jgi:hypothetical protein